LTILREANVKESATLRKERDALHQELATLRIETLELREDRKALHLELLTLREHYGEESKAQRLELATLNDEKDKLREERDSLKVDLITININNVPSSQDDYLMVTINTMREENNRLCGQRLALEMQLNTEENENSKLHSENRKLEKNMDVIRGQLENLRDDNEKLSEQCEKLTTISLANDKMWKEASKVSVDLATRYDKRESEFVILRDENTEVREYNVALVDKLRHFENERTVLHQVLATLRDKHFKLRVERDALHQESATQCAANVKESATLREERDALHQELTILPETIVKESATLREERDALHQELTILREANVKESATLRKERGPLHQELATQRFVSVTPHRTNLELREQEYLNSDSGFNDNDTRILFRKRNFSGGDDTENLLQKRREEKESSTHLQTEAHNNLISEVCKLIAQVSLLSSNLLESAEDFEKIYYRLSEIVIAIGSSLTWNAKKTIFCLLGSIRFGKILTRQSTSNGTRCAFGHINACNSWVLSIRKDSDVIQWNTTATAIIDHKYGKTWEHTCLYDHQQGTNRSSLTTEIARLLNIKDSDVLLKLSLQKYFSRSINLT
jgi:hypothetical protein